MKIILKNILKLDDLFRGGEADEHYDQRRKSLEPDSYVLKAGEVDISSIEEWSKICCKMTTDAAQTAKEISALFRWSNNPTNEEIDIAIKYFVNDSTQDAATNDTNKIIHLTDKGLSQQEAQTFLIKSFSQYHTKGKAAYSSRRNSERLSEIVLTYLSMTDARDFIETTKTLFTLYSEEAITGTEYGVAGVGILDYIESTSGTEYENAGLASKGYVLNGGATIQAFIDSLKDVLINGNY